MPKTPDTAPAKAGHWNPRRLDARALAQAGGGLQGELAMADLERLNADLHEQAAVDAVPSVAWRARGEMREGAAGSPPSPWLHLQARAVMPLTCQRCLGPVDTEVMVDRWFRFVADEAAAEAQDDDCEEDLLALEPRPDLLDVLEDELLMALPLVPMHDTCPADAPAVPPAAELEPASERPHPFAALAGLKKPK